MVEEGEAVKVGDWVRLKAAEDGRRGQIKMFDAAHEHAFVMWTDGSIGQYKLTELEALAG